jgi:enterochelin esterase family protein
MNWIHWLLLVCGILGIWAYLRWPRFSFSNQAQLLRNLKRIAAIRNPDRQHEQLNRMWESIHQFSALPCCEDNKALFVYRAPDGVTSVELMGDHNRWQPGEEDAFERLGNSPVWILLREFPESARIDYKFRVNQQHLLLDQENPFQQWSGFGPNSELRMPEFRPNKAVIPQQLANKGYLETNRNHQSKSLGYRVNYSIYHPIKEKGHHLPVLYVTDGHEFLNDKMGSFTTVMDNLISAGDIPPTYVVFLDPRNTDQSINRRMDEYGHHYAKYAEHLVNELIPAIESWQPDRDRMRRGIVGTSLGGQFAAWVCAKHSEVFGLGGILSPAFWYNDRNHGGEILQAYENKPEKPLRLFVGIGTLEGLLPDARRFHDMLSGHEVEHDYHETPQGHSWGTWRSMIDRMLCYLLGNHKA